MYDAEKHASIRNVISITTCIFDSHLHYRNVISHTIAAATVAAAAIHSLTTINEHEQPTLIKC